MTESTEINTAKQYTPLEIDYVLKVYNLSQPQVEALLKILPANSRVNLSQTQVVNTSNSNANN